MKKLLDKFILFSILLSTGFFGLLRVEIFTCMKIISILAIVMFVFTIIGSYGAIIKNNGTFCISIAFFLLFCICEFIISKVKYDQTFIQVIVMSIYYGSLLIYILFSYCINDKKIEYIRECFIKVSIILSIIEIIQFYLYKFNGITFLYLDLSIGQRFEEARIQLGAMLICIGAILSLGKIINAINNKFKFRKIDILNFLICTFNIIMVGKTRGILLVLLLSCFFMVMLGLKNLNNRILLIVTIIVIFLALLNSPIGDKYMELSSGGESQSALIRADATKYFIDKIFEEPILGMGFINPMDKYHDNYYIARGNNGLFFTDDVGIVGFTATFGLVGLIWYINLIFRSIKILFFKFKYQYIYENSEAIGMVCLLVFSSYTIIMTDAIRIFNLPFILIFIEYIEKKKIMKRGNKYGKST